jgi:hypothetical protein
MSLDLSYSLLTYGPYYRMTEEAGERALGALQGQANHGTNRGEARQGRHQPRDACEGNGVSLRQGTSLREH